MVRIGYASKNKTLYDTKNVHLSRTLSLCGVCQDGLHKGIHHLQKLASQNLQDLKTVVNFNIKAKIKIFIPPTTIFPYAADPYFGYSIKYADSDLRYIGKMMKKHKHRIMLHMPSCVVDNLLSQSHEQVYFLRYLEYCVQILESMNANRSAYVILSFKNPSPEHKVLLLTRLQERLQDLPLHLVKRIALENDPYNFTSEDLLPICKNTKIPFVFNTLHHSVNGEKKSIEFILQSEIIPLWDKIGSRPLIIHSESQNPYGDTMEERLVRSSHIERLPDYLQKLDCDVVVLSSSYEQSCTDVPHTIDRKRTLDFTEKYKEEYKEGIKILDSLP